MTADPGPLNEPRKGSRSLVALIRELPGLFIALAKAELTQFTAALKKKAIHAGIGIGLVAVALLLLFFTLAVLIAAAVLGLAVVFPGWLAALIVAGALLVIVVVLVLIAMSSFKKIPPLVPPETVASVKEDLNAIKGMGKYDR
ncbi:phage holin family protein [Rathayibacter soli]|uniref:phage holin family protein n=1 Tax=Rathayibacter soli TaxID=3144168 RepID=UPI0027E5BC24|nr:phage holin family protein [Glaciibacter superstes]